MYDKILIPLRIQPLHIGHVSLLKKASQMANTIIILITSSTKIDSNNPFFGNERELILKKTFSDLNITNYKIYCLPSFKPEENPYWINYVESNHLDEQTPILSGNLWIKNTFSKKGFKCINPNEVLENQINISASQIRDMIINEDKVYEKYLASGTKHYFNELKIKERIIKHCK